MGEREIEFAPPSQDTYRAIVETQTEMVCRFRPDGTILFVNPAYAATRGCAPEDLLGANFWDFIPHEDQAGVRELLDSLTPLEPAVHIENRFEGSGGSRWTLWTNRALAFDSSGKATEVQSSGIDITERKKAEEALKESESLLRAFLDNTPSMMGLVELAEDDSDVFHIFDNIATEAFFGAPRNATSGKWAIKDLGVEVETIRAWTKHYRESQRTRKSVRFPYYFLRSGAELWLSVTVSYVGQGNEGRDRFCYTAIDDTERVLAEKSVKESEQRFRALFTSIDEGYCLCEVILDDPGKPIDYRFLEINPLFESMTGLINPVGKTAYELVPDLEPFWVETYGRVALGNEPYRFEQGSLAMGRVFDVFATPVEGRGRFALVFKDITAQRESEEKLKRLTEELEAKVLQRTADLEGFVYSVAHDMRQHIRGVSINASLVAEEIKDSMSGDLQHVISRLQHSSKQMAEMVDDILALARIGQAELKKSEQELSVVAEQVTKDVLQRHYCNSATSVKIEPGLKVNADPVMLRILLDNLIDNACKYSSRQSSPVVEIGRQDGAFFVRDNGFVFDLAYAELAFKPFERLQTSYEGTGIGLANVKRIVERHGGEVWAVSSPGEGTTFYFTLS
jgi:PAS domain S-box-containing protein